MVRFRDKRFLAVAIVIAALVVFVLPAFVAFRYTAPEQRAQFLTRPWRGWSFAWAALAVPGGSQLKTSGMALRKADWVYKGTAVDPREVQLLFVQPKQKYTFTHTIDGRTLTSEAVPSYRFIWQVQGVVDTIPDERDTIVALLDYSTGRMLYDIRDDLTPAELAPQPGDTVRPARRRDPGTDEHSPMLTLTATASSETDWFKAVVYILIAVIMRAWSTSSSRAATRPSRPWARRRQRRPHPLRHDPASGLRRDRRRERRRCAAAPARLGGRPAQAPRDRQRPARRHAPPSHRRRTARREGPWRRLSGRPAHPAPRPEMFPPGWSPAVA